MDVRSGGAPDAVGVIVSVIVTIIVTVIVSVIVSVIVDSDDTTPE